ncbi:MAG: flavin oxidoreductase [Anaerofustis stercorihominis]|nr:flavin oxidoreductase [Anaerofustis stercorihominis]
MRKNFGNKPAVYPLPVLIIATYNENNTANAMNAAWGTVADTDRIAIYVSQGHKTMKNIMERKAFTVSIADKFHVKEADYLGIVSGNKIDNKLEKCGLHATKSEFVDAPVIDELPLCMECKFVSYDTESELLIGEVVNLSIDERILDENGNVDIAKFAPVAFDTLNKSYVVLGEKVGDAFSDGKEFR